MSRLITGPDFYRQSPNHLIVRRDGTVFTSPVEPYDPPAPEDDLDADPDFVFAFQPFQFRWNLNKYPQFAFIPKNVQFVGPLLGRLAHFKIEQTSNGRYAVARDTLESWMWLEDTLAVAINRFAVGFVLPMDVAFYTFPSQVGYKRAWKSRSRAYKTAILARDTFVVFVGLFSMFFSYHAERHLRSTFVPNTNPQPNVSTLLKADTGFSDSVVQDLIDMHSVLGTRVGCLVNISACRWFHLLHYALDYAGVSYWMVWGKAAPSLVSRFEYINPELRRYVPEYNVLMQCAIFLGKNDWPSISSGQLEMIDKREAHDTSQELPQDPHQRFEPIPNGQLQEETPKDFIKRRAEEEVVRREKASPDELLTWTHRERHADKRGWSSKSKVYHWPKIAGVRRRTIVEKNQVSDCWENAADSSDRTKKQRKYSAVFDEWDICTEFDSSDEAPLDDDNAADPFTDIGDEDPLVPLRPSQNATPPRQSHPLLPPPPVLPASHNQRGALFAHASGFDDKEVLIPDLDVLMYDRYGFDVEAMAFDIKQGIITLPSDALSLEKVAEILMERNAVASSRSEVAVRLIATLIDRGLPIPEQHWDLRNESLRKGNQGYFNILPLKLNSLHSDDVMEGYTVTPTSSRYLRPWVLFFESAIGVAQCIREAWGPSLEDVVCRACKNGYRIHMFVLKNGKALPRRMPPPPLFPRREREEGFIPSHFDFHAYQAIVDVLVKQQRLRAAVLRGGLLSRICSPYISLDEVAEGPSHDTLRYGSRWQAKGSDSVYVEDFISEDEINLLCGCFYVDTSRSSGRQTQFRSFSFFPRPDTWEKSGIHTVVWSTFAEQKFRKLLVQLNPASDSHSATPIPVPFKSNSQWKSHLRFHHKHTKRFLDYIETVSAALITSL